MYVCMYVCMYVLYVCVTVSMRVLSWSHLDSLIVNRGILAWDTLLQALDEIDFTLNVA